MAMVVACLLVFTFKTNKNMEQSGMPTSLKRESSCITASPDAMGESSSSGTARLDKVDSFRAL
ncbi:unnamed protein product [Ilex paraguariensis]|uniref:Uncharacterized protein n=1 Tax=Ilex paraguariensis TaxID=185542 RepID=A0ABC8SQR4_9AQUA